MKRGYLCAKGYESPWRKRAYQFVIRVRSDTLILISSPSRPTSLKSIETHLERLPKILEPFKNLPIFSGKYLHNITKKFQTKPVRSYSFRKTKFYASVLMLLLDPHVNCYLNEKQDNCPREQQLQLLMITEENPRCCLITSISISVRSKVKIQHATDITT